MSPGPSAASCSLQVPPRFVPANGRGFYISDADTGRFTALDPLGEKGGDNDWYGYCLDDPINRADVWGLEDSWIVQQQSTPEYKQCMNEAGWWRRQCKQAAEFGGYVLGEKRPLSGWGLGAIGNWLCEQTYEANAERCKEEYGSAKGNPGTFSPPDTSD